MVAVITAGSGSVRVRRTRLSPAIFAERFQPISQTLGHSAVVDIRGRRGPLARLGAARLIAVRLTGPDDPAAGPGAHHPRMNNVVITQPANVAAGRRRRTSDG